jgi:hypothetical protein
MLLKVPVVLVKHDSNVHAMHMHMLTCTCTCNVSCCASSAEMPLKMHVVLVKHKFTCSCLAHAHALVNLSCPALCKDAAQDACGVGEAQITCSCLAHARLICFVVPNPAEMLLKMPVVLGKHERLLESFRTGQGLSFDETGIDHCQMHRHAVSVTKGYYKEYLFVS